MGKEIGCIARQYLIYFITMFLQSWDPTLRMTPEEAVQHEWIREGLVHRRVKDSSRHHKHHSSVPSVSSQPTDPYKVPANPQKKGIVLHFIGHS